MVVGQELGQTADWLFEISQLCVSHQVGDTSELLIEDFALEVHRGEIVGLVGETGAGKSLSVLASVGLLPSGLRVVQGEVAFRGSRVPATLPARLRSRLGRGVCLLFQDARGALNPYMRVRTQIARALKIRGVPRKHRRLDVDRLLERVGLNPIAIASKYPHELSGGQAQRVAMAVALGTEPDLLIADEPTTALDVISERGVLELLQALATDRDMGVILITHNLGLVAQTCERTTFMHAGHIVERGATRNVFDAPLHPYTVGLMQLVPDPDRPRTLTPLAGSVPPPGSLAGRCRYADRCPHVWERCRSEVPPLYDREKRGVRCFLYDNERVSAEVAHS
ncbi:MAG: ABC transporter ATP-binding protein [Dehalococcoidia bacterium]